MLPGELPLLAFLEPIAADLANTQHVKEIVINRPGEVGIETHGWEWRSVPEFTAERMDQISILACQMAGKDFDQEHPIGTATLPGRKRFTSLRDPATHQGCPAITIRVPHVDERDIFDADFLDMTANTNKGGSRKAQVTNELLALYRERSWPHFCDIAVRSKKTILGIGKTGKGKTSLIRRLSRRIPLHERVVTIEDTDEYGEMLQQNRVSVFYGSPHVSALDGMEVSLRLRPDRIIMQELRGPEAFVFLRAEMAGHGGGMTTLHADMDELSADACFDALEMMAAGHDHAKKMEPEKLRKLIRKHVDIIIACDRDDVTDAFDLPWVWFRDAEEARA